jgi:hypothetical protein
MHASTFTRAGIGMLREDIRLNHLHMICNIRLMRNLRAYTAFHSLIYLICWTKMAIIMLIFSSFRRVSRQLFKVFLSAFLFVSF